MPVLNGSVVYRLKVVSNGIGPDVLDKRLTVNVNGFVRMATSGTGAISLGTEIPVIENTIHGSTSVPLWSVVGHAPVLILPVALGYNTVLMTATEFQHTKLIEVAIESCLTCSSGCSEDESSSRVLEAISTESSLFLLHKQQLHQFVGNNSLLSLKVPPSDSWRRVLPSVCVSAIVPVFLPHWGREYFYVLERGTLHRAEIYGSSYLFFSGFPVDQTIKYFVLSYHGEFAFVTEIEELWWGQEGVDQVLRLPPSKLSGSLLTVFYDSHYLLQAVVHRSEATGTGRIEKRHVPLAEIISYNAIALSPVEVQPHPGGFYCQPFEVLLEGLPRPKPYSRMQQYLVSSLVNSTNGLHSSASLAAYQGLLYHLLQLHSQYINAYALTSSGFSMEVKGNTLAEGSCESSLPDRLYLDRLSSFSLSVRVTCGNVPHLSAKKNRELCDTDSMFLSATVANNHYLSVSVISKMLFSYRSIIYKVTVMEREQYPGQAAAGKRMLSSSLLLQGLNRAAVYIGCPPGKRLVFDIGITLIERDRKCARLDKCNLHCPDPDISIPCFYYKQEFRPYFLIQDLVSGKNDQYDRK
ncbi:unnamed protein product [Lota lota]